MMIFFVLNSSHVLDITEGLHDMGGLQTTVVVSLIIAWIIVYCVLIKGVETFGKVRYFLKHIIYILKTEDWKYPAHISLVF